MKRIFVAIDISDEARHKVSDYIETLRRAFPRVRVSWEKTEKLHLTLKFLGDIDNRQLAEIKIVVKDISKQTTNFKLQISNTGIFPGERNPKILWIDVIDEKGSLAKINNLLENESKKIGFPREKRNFLQHLTIGRVREPNKARELAQKHLEKVFEPVDFEVSEIIIYESILQPAGSTYQKVSSLKLI